MRYDIYCDESRQDLLVSKASIGAQNRYCCIGGLLVPKDSRDQLKKEISSLRKQYSVFGELKWGTVSTNKAAFYTSLVDLFFSHKEVSSRVIVIDASVVDNEKYNLSDPDLGYYKFFYLLIKHWISLENEYYVYTDQRTTARKECLVELKHVLSNSILNDNIVRSIQAIKSNESDILQMQNVLMGAIGYYYNYGKDGKSIAKNSVIQEIESHIGQEMLPTSKAEAKFNIFKIELRGM